MAANGPAALTEYREAYPNLPVGVYDPATFNLEAALDGVDLALVHEWNEPELVAAIGRQRKHNRHLRVLFHDTHHRSVTEPRSMARYDLSHYDGVLAFGDSVRNEYLKHGWAERVWTFHEAADTRIFYPRQTPEITGDLVWIGNWGDDEREAELREFLIDPVRDLQLRAQVYGVRYPAHALGELSGASIAYGSFLPNYRAPDIFAAYQFTVHVPRAPYARALPGVPTIRMFEALACGIPLISAPWNDSEHLFPPNSYPKAANGQQMRELMRQLLTDPAFAETTRACGLEAVRTRHTCGHRATELLNIYAGIQPAPAEVAA